MRRVDQGDNYSEEFESHEKLKKPSEFERNHCFLHEDGLNIRNLAVV